MGREGWSSYQCSHSPVTVNVESGRGLCTQPLNVISSGELPLSSVLRPDSQTWTSSCEPSVRCVWSQRGGRTLITAVLSRHRFPPRPLDHRHACGPPVCRFNWSPHSRLPTVVRFHLGDFKRISSSRQTDTHERGSCVISCPNACVPPSTREGFLQTGQCFHVCLYQILRCRPEFPCCHYETALAPKPHLKEVRNLSYCTAIILPLFIPGCPENLRPGVDGGILILFPALRSAWLFSSAVPHIEQIFPWKLFITYETGGGDSWAVKS